MKSLFIIILIVLGILPVPISIKADYKQKQVDEFYLKHIRQAHPMPEIPADDFTPKLPIMPTGKGFSNFLNVNATPTETGQFRMQNESSIAVNPAHIRNLIASAVDYRDTSATWVYVSQDGGKTWVNKKLGRPYSGWTASNDPSVAFSNDGTGYLVVGGFGERSNGNTQAQIAENGIFLSRTTDDGNTWEPHIPVIVHRGTQTIDSTFEDKYYIWSDNSINSAFAGHLYIPWKRVWPKDSATQIVISKSTDKGSTWSSPIPVSPRLANTSEDTTYGQSFPLAVTGANGEVYVVWNNGIEHAVGFARSEDGGHSFTTPSIIRRYNIFGITTELEPGIWRHTVKSKVRAESYPSLVCDITDGPRKGWLYLTWAADNIPNIYFSRSTDKGDTWSSPVIIHSDTTNDQLWQWIALDNKNGDLAVMYLDSRDDPINLMTATYVSYSSDGGTTWIDRRAADISGDLRRNPFAGNSFAGDYSGCAFFDGKIYPSWIDMRDAETDIYDSDIYTALVDVNLPIAPQNFDAATIPESPDKIRLSWEKVAGLSFGHPVILDDVQYIIKRDGNQIVKVDGNTTEYFDSGLELFKLYHYSISTEYNSLQSGERKDSAWSGGSKEPGIPEIISIERTGNVVKFNCKIPSKRLDGITPFVNPKQLGIIRDNEKMIFSPLLTVADTSTIVSMTDEVEKNGFYIYRTFMMDSYLSVSPYSDTLLIYAGNWLTEYTDDFDEPNLRSYLNRNGWGLTSTFSRSGNSLTDSPSGDYKAISDSSIVIFPFENKGKEVMLSFWHAAFVQNRDSAIVEYSDDYRKTWKILSYFDKEMFEPWKDDTKTADDWKYEIFNVKSDNSSIYFRFRLRTNATKNDDGWYIDDLSFSTASSINDEDTKPQLIIYPNPVKDRLNLTLTDNSGTNIKEIKIFDLLGNVVLEAGNQNVEKWPMTITTMALRPGFYTICIILNNQTIILGKFSKI